MAAPALDSASTATLDNNDSFSSEEFPLQKSGEAEGDELVTAELVAVEVKAKHAKPKRFSLRGIAKPFARAPKGVQSKPARGDRGLTDSAKELKPARKSTEGKREADKVSRRVSFSPSTEEATEAREKALSVVAATDYAHERKAITDKGRKRTGGLKRRASYNDSIGRRGAATARKRSVSFSWDRRGVHVAAPKAAAIEAGPVVDKGRVSRPRVTKQQAIAARHARALEQIINAGASLDFDSVEELKTKRERKTAGRLDHSKVQMIPAVSPRKVLALKRALLDSAMANDIIGELRFMQLEQKSGVPTPPSSAIRQGEAAHLLETVLSDSHAPTRKIKARPMPKKAICLDCTEVEAHQRQQRRQRAGVRASAATEKQGEATALQQKETVAMTTAVAGGAAAIWGFGQFFKPKSTTTKTTTITDSQGQELCSTTVTSIETPASEAYRYVQEIREDVGKGDVAEAAADMARISVVALKQAQPIAGALAESVEKRLLPVNKELEGGEEKAETVVEAEEIGGEEQPASAGILAGVSPISLILSPGSTAATAGLSSTGAFDAIGSLSGIVIQAANGGLEGMQEVRPPLDRMAIFIHWWGFEVTLPGPSMNYLGTAQSVSGSFLTFLQTMVVTGGVPELLPFVRYFSSFVDMEFGAIKSQNHGHGVVIAATWLMPMALVPRPWDYPTTPPPPPSSPAPAPAQPSPPPSSAQPSPNLPLRRSSVSSLGSPRRRSPSPNSLSSRERHVASNREAGIASAASESASSHMAGTSLLGLQASHSTSLLDSLEEVPEGSIRVR